MPKYCDLRKKLPYKMKVFMKPFRCSLSLVFAVGWCLFHGEAAAAASSTRKLQQPVVLQGFQLVAANSDQVLADIVAGSVVALNSLPTSSLNIIAVPAEGSGIGSVKFGLDGNANFRTENKAPFAACGDKVRTTFVRTK